MLQLKHCNIEKDGDQLILAILSKLGPDYSIFISTFHIRNLAIPNLKMTSLDSFIKTLTNENYKLLPMGILRPSKNQALFASGSKYSKGKGKESKG